MTEFFLDFCGDMKNLVDDKNLFSALEEVDRLGDIDMDPMNLLGTDSGDNFDLFAEIEKYETEQEVHSQSPTESGFTLGWENPRAPPTVQQARSSVIVGRPQPPVSKSPKILPGAE